MEPKSAIILCTCNGGKFLAELYHSLENQLDSIFDIYIGDDNSCDDTIELLRKLDKKNKLIKKIFFHNHKNPAKNFIDTLKKVPNKYEYYFFCDQDDIWMQNKINESTKTLQLLDCNGPKLFCGRTTIINHKGNITGFSPLFSKKPSIENAIVQSIAGGNTMCFNGILKKLLEKISLNDEIVAHDWISYILCAAYDGVVIYSKEPLIYYRDHSQNAVGPNKGLFESMKRILLLLSGEYHEMNKKNLHILSKFKTPYVEFFAKFEELQSARISKRVKLFFDIGIYRQTFLSNLALFFSVVIKKI